MVTDSGDRYLAQPSTKRLGYDSSAEGHVCGTSPVGVQAHYPCRKSRATLKCTWTRINTTRRQDILRLGLCLIPSSPDNGKQIG